MKRIISGLLLTICFAIAAPMLFSTDCQAQNPISREKKEQKPVQKPKEQPKHNPNPAPKHTPKSAPEVKVPDARTSYRSMDLQTRRNGQYYYFNPDEWGALTAAQKALFTKDGVVMKVGNEEFAVALHDMDNGDSYPWKDAMMLYGDILPTKSQGEILVEYENILNKRLKAYNGDVMDKWYWTNTEYDSTHAWYINMNGVRIDKNTNKNLSYRVRAVALMPGASPKPTPEVKEPEASPKPVHEIKEPEASPKPAPEVKVPNARTSYNHLDLQTRRDGIYYYFNPEEWGALTAAQKALFTKDGVVMKIDKMHFFVVALCDQDNGKVYSWKEARSLFGDMLPSEFHIAILIKNKNILNERLKAYDGDVMDQLYWTSKEFGSSKALVIIMNNVSKKNDSLFPTNKSDTNRVRAVSPISVVPGN